MEISGNTILITGGTSGIGRSLAIAFSEAGNRGLVCGRRADRLEELHREHPEIICGAYDITLEQDRQTLLQWAIKNNVNVLYNNAGIQKNVDFTKGLEDLREPNELDVNLNAVIMLTASFVPYLIRLDHAAIFTTTSGLIYMERVRSNVPLYIATKLAIHAFTVHLRRQLENTSVEVIETVPPIVDTEINPEGRALRKMAHCGISPDQFASYILEGIQDKQETIFARDKDYPNPLTRKNRI